MSGCRTVASVILRWATVSLFRDPPSDVVSERDNGWSSRRERERERPGRTSLNWGKVENSPEVVPKRERKWRVIFIFHLVAPFYSRVVALTNRRGACCSAAATAAAFVSAGVQLRVKSSRSSWIAGARWRSTMDKCKPCGRDVPGTPNRGVYQNKRIQFVRLGETSEEIKPESFRNILYLTKYG